jgi:hypothetical protein
MPSTGFFGGDGGGSENGRSRRPFFAGGSEAVAENG